MFGAIKAWFAWWVDFFTTGIIWCAVLYVSCKIAVYCARRWAPPKWRRRWSVFSDWWYQLPAALGSVDDPASLGSADNSGESPSSSLQPRQKDRGEGGKKAKDVYEKILTAKAGGNNNNYATTMVTTKKKAEEGGKTRLTAHSIKKELVPRPPPSQPLAPPIDGFGNLLPVWLRSTRTSPEDAGAKKPSSSSRHHHHSHAIPTRKEKKEEEDNVHRQKDVLRHATQKQQQEYGLRDRYETRLAAEEAEKKRYGTTTTRRGHRRDRYRQTSSRSKSSSLSPLRYTSPPSPLSLSSSPDSNTSPGTLGTPDTPETSVRPRRESKQTKTRQKFVNGDFPRHNKNNNNNNSNPVMDAVRAAAGVAATETARSYLSADVIGNGPAGLALSTFADRLVPALFQDSNSTAPAAPAGGGGGGGPHSPRTAPAWHSYAAPYSLPSLQGHEQRSSSSSSSATFATLGYGVGDEKRHSALASSSPALAVRTDFETAALSPDYTSHGGGYRSGGYGELVSPEAKKSKKKNAVANHGNRKTRVSLTQKQRFQLWEVQGRRCAHCKNEIPREIGAAGKPIILGDVDHAIPISASGADHISNMQFLCPTCHKFKTVITDRFLYPRSSSSSGPSAITTTSSL